MQSKASTVAEYVASLPEDRRSVIEAVRNVVNKNLDPVFEEGMQYGMIGYYVPHSVYPNGYHCDPRQPLPCMGLAAQKNAYSIYFMALYMNPELLGWFTSAWKKSGKKLDMGKSCIRFKNVDDLALEVLGETVRRVKAKTYIDIYESNLAKAGKPAVKKASKKVAKKTVKKKTASKR